MSSTLYMYPTEPHNEEYLSDDLKRIIGRRFCGTDGSIGHNICLTEEDLTYIQGLCDAGVKDAGKLAKFIKKHKNVTLEWRH